MEYSELKKKLESTLDFLTGELGQIRAGGASPRILEDLPINAYDTTLTVKEVGTISVIDSNLLTVTPWDLSLLPILAKTIRESELNLNPSESDGMVRVPIPPLTEERRLELVKLVASKVESSKQAVRNLRQDAMKTIDTNYTNKLLSEDEKFTNKDEVETLVKEYSKKIEELFDSKKKSLLSI